jgi:hypothetical protein
MPFMIISRLLSFYSSRTSLMFISLHLYGWFAFMTVLTWDFLKGVLTKLFSLMTVLTYGCSHFTYGVSHL